MSKTTIGVILGIIIIAVVGYFGFSDKKLETNNSNESGEVTNEKPAGKKMAFSQFVKQGGAYECTVNQSVGGTDTKGTTFISNGMIRGEYSTASQGMNINSYFIVRDGYSYAWSSMMPNVGFKTKVVASAQANTDAPASGQYSFNADQIGDYECKAWNAAESKFAIPATIKFQDLGGK